MKKQKIGILFIIILTTIVNSSFSQLSYSLSNKFWRLKYANIGGREYSFNSSNDNAPTMQISGGSLRGNGGCNAYHTKFTIDGNSMDIGNIMSTRMACNGMYLEESTYFNALSKSQVIYYTEGSNELKLMNNIGDQLIFFAQFTRSAETRLPPVERRSYSDDDEVRPSRRHVRHERVVKLSKKEMARQKLLEKKMKSKKGKLTKKEKRELMALQSKTKKAKVERLDKRKNKKGRYAKAEKREGKKGKAQKNSKDKKKGKKSKASNDKKKSKNKKVDKKKKRR